MTNNLIQIICLIIIVWYFNSKSYIRNDNDNLIKEISVEDDITTIVNTHDMNSVMEIGDSIAYINNGKISWTGNKEELLQSNNEQLNNFVFASELFKRLKNT